MTARWKRLREGGSGGELFFYKTRGVRHTFRNNHTSLGYGGRVGPQLGNRLNPTRANWLMRLAESRVFLPNTSTHMVSRLRRLLGKFSCVPSRGEKAASRDIQLPRSVGRGSTPPPAALELELAHQRTECARLDQEYQRARAEADGFAEAKGKLDDELREVKALLEARVKEVGQKDASIQRLESEMKTKVSQVGGGIGFDS